MVDLKLKRLTLRNWAKFGHVDLELPESGVVMVLGQNEASGGAMHSVGCHPKGQRVVMWTGELKAIEQLKVGDELAGPDSAPRRVIQLFQGTGPLWQVQPVKGKPFTVNADHVLAIYFTKSSHYKGLSGTYTTVTVRDFLKWPKSKQAEAKLYRPGLPVHFKKSNVTLPVEPRILGLWLGDGNSAGVGLTTASYTLAKEWAAFGRKNNLRLRVDGRPGNRSRTLHLAYGRGGNKIPGTKRTGLNLVHEALKSINVLNNKHIPESYLCHDVEERMQLLSGLLDTDGTADHTGYVYTTVSPRLAADVERLANSLGFFTLSRPVVKKCQTGASGTYYNISIIGSCHTLPTRIKKAPPRRQKKKFNVTGFKLNPVSAGDFYGVELDRDGLYLLDDYTVTHNSGKSSIGEAISRTLLGVKGRKEHLKGFSTDGKGNTYVRVEASFLGKPLIVESGYACKELSTKSEALRFTYDGQQVERGNVRQTREELVKLLRISPLLAAWTIFVNGKKMDFSQLSQSESVELVMSALRQPPWNEYHEKAKEALAAFRRTLARDEQALTDAEQRVNDARQDVSEAKDALNEADRAFKQAVRDNENRVVALQASIGKLLAQAEEMAQQKKALELEMKAIEDSKAEEHHALEIKQHELQDSIRNLREAAKPLQAAVQRAVESNTEARTHYMSYRDAERQCPTCKRPVGDKLDPGHLTELKEVWDKANSALKLASEKLEKHRQKSADAENKLEQVSRDINALAVKHDVESKSQEHDRLSESLQRILVSVKSREADIERVKGTVSDAEVRAAKTTLAERQRVLTKAKTDHASAAEALVVSQATLKVMEYWRMAYSPYGIPNLILRDAIAPLNAEAKRVSAMLTGGTIEVVYSTTREMASGMEKAQLNIEVNNQLGDKDLAGSSNGEAGLTNLIISDTLAAVGQTARRIGYRWYDEVVPYQDPKVCQTVYRYWRETAHKNGVLIFMVDHNPLAANYADYTLIVDKKGSPQNCKSSARWG